MKRSCEYGATCAVRAPPLFPANCDIGPNDRTSFHDKSAPGHEFFEFSSGRRKFEFKFILFSILLIIRTSLLFYYIPNFQKSSMKSPFSNYIYISLWDHKLFLYPKYSKFPIQYQVPSNQHKDKNRLFFSIPYTKIERKELRGKTRREGERPVHRFLRDNNVWAGF